jgi:signal transduction histidine kinase
MRTDAWRNVAAFGTWIVVGLPTAARIASGRFDGPAAMAWSAAFAIFGVALTPCLLFSSPRRRPVLVSLLVVQSVAGLTMMTTSGEGTATATLVIVAAEVASIFPLSVAWAWVAVQSAAITAIGARLQDLVSGIAIGGAFAGFQAFAVSTVALARSERVAREALARANAELHATRALLAENSRVDERLRIARDLHDTLGHHLAALSLQLDVASRLADDRAAEHVRQAHAITRLLLSDVRDVVSRMRDSGRIDLAQAIRALVPAPGGDLHVHLDIPDTLAIDDSARADAILRCVQEIITNTARHAAAANLWIRLEPGPDGIALHARDDGRGASSLTWGNGLRGMRERFEEHSGRVEFDGAAGRGFEVRGFMPAARATS